MNCYKIELLHIIGREYKYDNMMSDRKILLFPELLRTKYPDFTWDSPDV